MKSKDSNSKKSVAYQKEDARTSFFWYDNEKDLKVCFLVTPVVCVWHTVCACVSLDISPGFDKSARSFPLIAAYFL